MISILVVDDEQSMRDFLKILLIKEGYRVSTAENGNQALSLLSSQPFDLVISDIRMPGMGGLELLESIREDHGDLPVIMITAFASPNDAVQAMKNGAFDYISKPFNVDEIKSVILSATSKEASAVNRENVSDLFPNIIGKSREMIKFSAPGICTSLAATEDSRRSGLTRSNWTVSAMFFS